MGYYSTIEGEVYFSRPINKREAAPLIKVTEDPWNVYKLISDTEECETDEGTLTITRTVGIEPVGDEGKAYEWESILRRLIDALPGDVTAEGQLERSGEENGDMERLYIKGRTVIAVKPEIVWKDPFQ